MIKKISLYRLMTRKNIFIVLAFLSLQVVFFLIMSPMIINFYLHSEKHFDPQPEIDTIFTSNFTKEHFDKVENGMTLEQVKVLLGEPFRSENIKVEEVENGYGKIFRSSDNAQCLRYSQDGKLGSKADFSWYSYKVCLENNRVYLKLVEEFFD